MLYFTASYFVRFVSGTIISLFILISMKVIVLCLAVLEYKQIYYLKNALSRCDIVTLFIHYYMIYYF